MVRITYYCDKCGKESARFNLYRTKIGETKAGIKIFKRYCSNCKRKMTGIRPIGQLSRIQTWK